MRAKCELCAIKHLAQAMVLLDESQLGYPLHKWLACGHMAEAESELLNGMSELSCMIRNERVKIMEQPNYQPDIETIIAAIDAIIAAENQNVT